MYYLIETKEEDFNDFRVVTKLHNIEDFYNYIDNNHQFGKNEFINTIQNGLDTFGGIMDLSDGFKLVNTSYNSKYTSDPRLLEFKTKIRNLSIDNIIDES